MDYVTLHNGVKMPQLGYGVYQVSKDECERCVLDALKVGYRHIDTAQSYFNEEEVGNAIEKSGIPRKDIFITTKVWIEHYGYEQMKKYWTEAGTWIYVNSTPFLTTPQAVHILQWAIKSAPRFLSGQN